MKKSIIILLLLPLTIFSQSVKTKKVKVSIAEKLIKEVYYVKRLNSNVKEGKYVQYFNKVKITEGNYSNNKKNGSWNYYDFLGKCNFSGEYVNDIKDGKWTYNINGYLISDNYYTDGIVDSSFRYYENGKILNEIKHYKDSTGIAIHYYKNGKIKEFSPLKNRSRNGICKLYFKNGQLHSEMLYKESHIISVISTFNKEGIKIDGGNLKDGNGNFISYYLSSLEENKLQKRKFQQYKNGKLDGLCEYYYENGVLECKDNYKDGELHGISLNYYESGKLESEYHYKDGKLDGLCKKYYKSEALKSKGYYTDGNRVDKWTFYNESGSIKKVEEYKQDEKKDEEKPKQNSHFNKFSFWYDIYEITEFPPSFQGGDRERINFLIKNVKYPVEALEKGISGTVYVSFVVEPTGEISEAKISTGVDKSIDEEALRVIKLMPRWNPGFQRGRPVRVQFNMPIKFTLAD